MENDELFTIKEAAAFLKTSRANVYNLMKRQEVEFVQLAGARRIWKSAILNMLEKRTVRAEAA